MTDPPISVNDWRAAPPSVRRVIWQRMSNAERGAMYGLLSATTPEFGLPYPDDYNDPADSPTAFRELAQATEAALLTRVARTGDGMTGPLSVPTLTANHVIAPTVSVGDVLLTPGSPAGLDGSIFTTSSAEVSVREGSSGGLVPLQAAPAAAPTHALTLAQSLRLESSTSPFPACQEGFMRVALIEMGDIAPGQIAEQRRYYVPGTFVLCSVQHPSTYLHAIANLEDAELVNFRVRNSAEATTMSDVKLHALYVNPHVTG